MNTCAAPGCMEPTSQRCSSCKTTKYCSRECQRRDWIVGGHKDRCRELAQQRGATDSAAALQGRSTVGIVSIFDQQVSGSIMSLEELPTAGGPGAQGWELCPVVNMLGVPLAIKKVAPCGCHICLGGYSQIPEPRNQVATRLAIEPHNGLAPPKWQGGPHNHLGTVAVARTDFKDFTVEDWRVLDDYIYNTIFGVWGMETSERNQLLPRVCNSQAFTSYAAAAGRSQEVEEEAAYGASFGGGFVG
ncbi:unnamed protein product [Ectocarpus fasciculatus]